MIPVTISVAHYGEQNSEVMLAGKSPRTGPAPDDVRLWTDSGVSVVLERK